jgi:hypothetical protein
VAIALGMAIAEVRKAQIVQFRNWLSQLAGSTKPAPGAQPR